MQRREALELSFSVQMLQTLGGARLPAAGVCDAPHVCVWGTLPRLFSAATTCRPHTNVGSARSTDHRCDQRLLKKILA